MTWLRSEFADAIPMGANVDVLMEPTLLNVSETTGVCREIKVIKEGELIRKEVVSATELVDLIDTPHQVTVRGTVQTAVQRPKGIEVQLADNQIRYIAMVQARQTEQLTETLQTGNVVQMTGARRLHPPSYDGPSAFKLVVNDGSTVTVVADSFQDYAKQFAWIFLPILGAMGTLFMGNRIVKSKVRKRTRDAIAHAARLQASCNAICEGFFFFDQHGRLTQTFGNAASFLDGAPEKNLPASQAGYQIAQHLKSPEKFLGHWQSAFADNHYLASHECALLDGSRVFVIDMTPFTDVNGNFDGRLCTIRDVTERRKMEQEVTQSQKLIAVGRLAGGIAHDFNNLLMAISANVTLAQQNADGNEAVIQHAKIADEAVSRASELTKSLLSFSRRSDVSRQVGHVNDCVNQVGLLMRHMLDEKVDFCLMMAPDLWLTKIDSSQIEHTLLNLCINARDALKPGGGHISIQTNNVQHPELGPCVKISVQDDGCGMSAETAALVFEPFFTTKDVGHGTGLGLSMAFGIIQQHEGVIKCHSKLDEGSQFDIFLPRTTAPLPRPSKVSGHKIPVIKRANDDAGMNAKVTRQPPEELSDESKRILLVDDEPMIRDAGSALLSALGHETVCASDGQHALAILSEDDGFDIVLLDLTMPVMSGQETLRQIKTRYPNMKVVICTGYSVDMDSLGNDIATAPEAVLAKPFSIDDIRRVLRQSTCSR